MPELGLGLGLWQGSYQNIERQWLRWFNAVGDWLPTPTEREAQLLEQERRRTQRLIEQLRSLGVEPDLSE